MIAAPGRRLRELLSGPDILIAPGAYDALMGKLIEQAGFSAAYLSGAGVANTLLGRPDVGLVTMTEMVTRAGYLCEALNIPVIADCDTGYGNAINVARAVREYERAGVAAVQIEDQVFPKRCGHMLGREVVSISEMVGKIKAALDARRDTSLVVVARTDARTSYGLDEAIERGQRYADAGADVVFVESPETVDEMRRITISIDSPLLANMVETGRTPLLSASELQEIGYSTVIFPGALTRFLPFAARQLLAELRRTGTTRGLLARMMSFIEVNEVVGLPEIQDMEERYGAG
ncbi:MAG: oxaloacetate decarboxylase [Chloroflexota bacterium]|nr:oxaloacetate decarboxylase [Chloroflexota bacterium]